MHSLQIVVVGDAHTGKSCLIRQFMYHKFDQAYFTTREPDAMLCEIATQHDLVGLNFIDTSGNIKYRALNEAKMVKADVIVLVFDVTEPASFVGLEFWIDRIQEITPHKISGKHRHRLVIVGNKCEDALGIKVNNPAVNKFTKARNLPYQMVSAKTGMGVEHVFWWCIRSVYPNLSPGIQFKKSEKDNQNKCVLL